jgi:hypothetical protein
MLKRIFNLHEEVTQKRLREVCEMHGAHAYPKVRVADILPIENSGIDDALYKCALQSHFDFVVADGEHLPLFAVEFDGPGHRQQLQRERDSRKNALCDRFEFPLLRINARYLPRRYRDMDLLTWFVQVWFAQRWFEEAQAAGQVPYDEPFMPQSFVSLPGQKNQFPLWLSATVRGRIQKLFFDGKVLDMAPSHLTGRDSFGDYHAISFMRVDERCGVLAETGMRSQRFPVSEIDALDEIVTNELYDQLSGVLSGRDPGIPGGDIERRIAAFAKSYKMCHAYYVGGSYTIPDGVFTRS